MNRTGNYSDHGGTSHVRWDWMRWGGGARPGRTHAWSYIPGWDGVGWHSVQCVTDDFGNLVPAVQA